MTKVYNEHIAKVCFFGEPTKEQKEKGYALMDECGKEILKKIDYKNHPDLKRK